MKGFAPEARGVAGVDGHDIRSIVAYLRSGADAARMAPKQVQGTPARGEELYLKTCSQCHGTWERESFAPHLADSAFLAIASDTYLQATMSLGRHGSAMRSMLRGGGGLVELGPSEANNIISYLREHAKSR